MKEFKKIFITGGAGYVGSLLVPSLLELGYMITVYDLMIYGENVLQEHPNLTIIKGDIRNKEKLKWASAGADTLIHLACISNDPSFDLNPELGKSVNFDAFYNIIESCKDNKIKRLIMASSTSQYGIKPLNVEVTEDSSAEPITDYAKYKIECERLLQNTETGDLEYVFVRPATLCGYAPRLRLDLSVNILTINALINKKIKIFGGSQMRPALNIKDMVRFYELMLIAPKEKIHNQAFNVAYNNMTIQEIGNMVKNTIADENVIFEVTPSNDNRSYHVNCDKMKNILDFECKYGLDDAVLSIKKAYEEGLISDGLNNSFYFNIKRMKERNLEDEKINSKSTTICKDNIKVPTVVVIGSNSFSGSHYIDFLLEKTNYNILGISRSPENKEIFLPYKNNPNRSRFTFHQLDLNKDIDQIILLIDELQAEYIVNFASQSMVGQSWDNPDHWYNTNVLSTVKLTNSLKDKDYLKKYVHVSTPEVYGSCSGSVKEDNPFNPSTPYAGSRAAADDFIYMLIKQFNFPAVFTRAANVYGPGQQLFKIIPRAIIYSKLGKKIPLHGGGNAKRAFIDIRDVCEATLQIMEKAKPGDVYHLSTNTLISVRDLVSIIVNKLGKSFDEVAEVVETRRGLDDAYILDSTKAKIEFNWQPKINLEEGINQTINWINNNWEIILKENLEYIHKE